MSDMPHQERLVRRVRKLLELSRNNSNAHEAGLALARAQQLMAKHGITEQDADFLRCRRLHHRGTF